MTPPRYPNEDAPTGCLHAALVVALVMGFVFAVAIVLHVWGVL